MARKKLKYPIRFFYFDKMVGEFECPELQSEANRRKIATDNNIDKWTHFILGDNRAIGVKLEESGHIEAQGPIDCLALLPGDYLVWVDPDCKTTTIKLNL